MATRHGFATPNLAALEQELAQLLAEAEALGVEVTAEQSRPEAAVWNALAARVAPIGTQAVSPTGRTMAALQRRVLRLQREASYFRMQQDRLLDEGARLRAERGDLVSRCQELSAWAGAVAEHSRAVAEAARREMDILRRRLDRKGT